MNRSLNYMTWLGVLSLFMVAPIGFAASVKINDLDEIKIIQKELIGKWRCSAHNTEDQAFFEFEDDFRDNGMVYSSGVISAENESGFSNAKVEIESRWRIDDAMHVYYDEIKTLNIEANNVEFKKNLEDMYAERISARDEILLLNANERVFREIDENHPNLPSVQCVKLSEVLS